VRHPARADISRANWTGHLMCYQQAVLKHLTCIRFSLKLPQQRHPWQSPCGFGGIQ